MTKTINAHDAMMLLDNRGYWLGRPRWYRFSAKAKAAGFCCVLTINAALVVYHQNFTAALSLAFVAALLAGITWLINDIDKKALLSQIDDLAECYEVAAGSAGSREEIKSLYSRQIAYMNKNRGMRHARKTSGK